MVFRYRKLQIMTAGFRRAYVLRLRQIRPVGRELRPWCSNPLIPVLQWFKREQASISIHLAEWNKRVGALLARRISNLKNTIKSHKYLRDPDMKDCLRKFTLRFLLVPA